MAIVATNETLLAWFTDLLHDCFLLIPQEGIRAEDKVLKLVFQDKERTKFKDRSTLLDLRVYQVEEVHATGDLARLPGPMAQLNDIAYERRNRLVIFDFVHPYRLTCKVAGLRISLDEAVADATAAR